MRGRTVGSIVLCAGLVAVLATPASAADTGSPAAAPKSLAGSFVVFDPSAGGAACWAPSTSQTLCFGAESFTTDWEYAYYLILNLPTDWTVVDIAVAGSPVCDSGSFGSFSWWSYGGVNEPLIEHYRYMSPTDHCTAFYCIEVTTGSGSGDALVSWYWDGDGYGGTPHYPCSDDGFTPSGMEACDQSVQPRAAIPDCSSFGSLEGTIRDAATGGPTCAPAVAAIEPGGLSAPADGSGAYGPVFLSDGLYDVTASAPGYDDLTAPGVAVVAGVITTQDFDLGRPVLEALPTSFDVSLAVSSSGDETLGIGNLGSSPALDWSLRELPPTETANPFSGTAPEPGVAVEAELAAAMDSRGEAGLLIDFRERPDLSPALGMDWHERGRFVVDVLRESAARSQARVREYLDRGRVPYQAFWIDNLILVPSARREVLGDLQAFDEIEVLRARRTMDLIEPVARVAAPSGGRAVEPNIDHVEADQVWALGFTGDGLVVANIDTGVRYTHDVLEPHYRGNLGGGAFDHAYNWLDGVDGSAAAPSDDHGHGSHTMGTMVGDDGGANQVGMAPGATWIACDACEASGGCPEAALLTCAQWIVAPYPAGSPSSADPSKRPHVVNNSWGDCGRSYDNWYQGVVDSWHAAGVYPVFSNGNASNCGYSTPPGCNTVGNPGRYGNVTGVGSTGQFNGAYATHSNWGPTDNLDTVNPEGYPSIKPQVAAPGVNIRSATASSDTSYGSWNGTSMSAPHVGGLVALMWQAGPCLVGDYAQTETIIMATATAIPYASNCGGEGPGNLPNQATGWGEIDALTAVTEATVWCNADWLPWVSETPTDGQVVAGGADDVTLTFTCGTDPGDQTGTLRLTTNDPCAETTDLPLALHCTDASSADLTVTKSDGVATVVPGEGLSYTIVVGNAGPDDVVGATVVDAFPAELTGVTWTCAAAGGASCTAAGSGDIGDAVDLPVGGTATYTAVASVDTVATGTLSNTATVAPPAGVIDPDPGDNSATDLTDLVPSADLAVTKTDGLGFIMPGDQVTYTISVTNAGPSDAPGSLVSDVFPAELSGTTWTCAAAGGASCTAAGSGDIADTVSLPAGGSLVYTATGTLAASAAGTLANTATVAPAAGVTDPDPGDNSATDLTTVGAFTELHGRVDDGVCWVAPGEVTTYTVTVVNDGPGDAIGALVEDSPPAILTGLAWTCTASGGASCTASGVGAISQAVDLPAGGSVVFELTGTVDPGATGWLLNEATVTPPVNCVDPTPDNAVMWDLDALEPPVLCDGFEDGSTAGWSATVP
ncbi:MAG TPA: S8 family serine peptidase [Methylomirabilota bacterium]|nr:S8 family serine peptidase [Methylomirabilota bacterium]